MAKETETTLKSETQAKRRPVRHTKRCQFEGCDKWAWAQGYCDPHYQKLKAQGVIQKKRVFGDALERFHTKYEADPITGCWNWQGAVNPHGYGQYPVHENGKTRAYRAHRFAYENLVGPIPHGMMVLHDCDNRRCCRPSHLRVGTGSDNIKDCVARGRHKSQNGKRHPTITPAMALNIRIMYAKGLVLANVSKGNPFSILNIARIYGVEHATIWGIVKGRSHLVV